MDTGADVEKKLGLSLDELIAQQKAKQAKKGAATPGGKGGKGGKAKAKGPARVQKVQTAGGGRVLVVPRPGHVPRPGTPGGKQAALLKATRGGGVRKGGPSPKLGGGTGGQRGGGQGAGRSVKVTIGNKLSGRPAAHIPTSGVLAKPFLSGGAGSGGSGRSSRTSTMQMDGPGAHGGGGGGGGALGSRFDHMQGFASSGPARPTGAPRRNAHGVILP